MTVVCADREPSPYPLARGKQESTCFTATPSTKREEGEEGQEGKDAMS